MNAKATTILDGRNQDWIPVLMPGAEGTFIKVLKADEEERRIVFQFRFSPNTSLPRHSHDAWAVAYTVSGHWEYEEGPFDAGMVAYEVVGNDHTPRSDVGAELFVIMGSNNDDFLVNYMPDGSVIRFKMRFFKALEGLDLMQAAKLDFAALVN
jgi:hypothetical protein